MSRLEDRRNYLIDQAQELLEAGYRVFLYYDEKGAFTWLYVVTPDNSLMYIQNGYYGGLDVSYQYPAQKDFGTGCRCNDEPIYHLTVELMEEFEKYGKSYGAKTWHLEYTSDGKGHRVYSYKKPKHYPDATEALKSVRHYDELIELDALPF